MKNKNFFLALIVLFFIGIGMSSSAQDKSGWLEQLSLKESTRQLYFPQQNIYYDLQEEVYIYPFGGEWVKSYGLPPFITAEELENSVKVQLSLDTQEPQEFNREHRVLYAKSE